MVKNIECHQNNELKNDIYRRGLPMSNITISDVRSGHFIGWVDI